MITEYIRYTLANHEPAALIAAYVEAGRHLAAASECIAYELTQCIDDEKNFILRIHWTSAPAHLQGFRGGEHFPPFLAAIQPFITEIAEMRHYETVPEVSWSSIKGFGDRAQIGS